jgi:hypothetical protein
MDTKTVDIYYLVDEFCREIEKTMENYRLPKESVKKTGKKSFILSDSEVITVMILFHQSHCRDLKYFYINHIRNRKADFPQTVSYNRFVELQRSALLPMVIFLQVCCPGKCTGISIIDSTPVRVCHIKREKSHKVFKGLATKGKSTVDRFFGFKLHLIVNDKGEIIEFLITQANIDDREPLKDRTFHEKLSGKLFGDRGHISKDPFEKPFIGNIHPITKIKKNMKNTPMHLQDKIILGKVGRGSV